jgi:hypothetical protein
MNNAGSGKGTISIAKMRIAARHFSAANSAGRGRALSAKPIAPTLSRSSLINDILGIYVGANPCVRPSLKD